MAFEDSSQLLKTISERVDVSLELQGKCDDNHRKLEVELQTLKSKIADNLFDKNSEELKRTIRAILSKHDMCKNFDKCIVQDRIQIQIKDLGLLIKGHELDKREQEQVTQKRNQPGRRQTHQDNDSAYESATSANLTDSQCELSSPETRVLSPSSEQDTSPFAFVPSCSPFPAKNDKCQNEQRVHKETQTSAENDYTGASNEDLEYNDGLEESAA